MYLCEAGCVRVMFLNSPALPWWFSILNHSEEKFYFFHIQDWYWKDDIKTHIFKYSLYSKVWGQIYFINLFFFNNKINTFIQQAYNNLIKSEDI